MFEENDTGSTQVVEASALQKIVASEIDVQISTAKRFPRSMKKFEAKAMELATKDPETAASCFYVLKRKDRDGGEKFIEGPSVRLAEIIGSSWGNLRYGARIVDVGERFVVAQGVCHDLETNVCMSHETQRRITTKSGARYGDDMIQMTCNAACAIALREAILKVVPRSLIKGVYDAAKQTAVGKAMSMDQRRAAIIEYFSKMGVGQDRVLAAAGVAGIGDLDLDAVTMLRGLATAIKDGETTIDEAFPKAATAGTNGAAKKPLADILGEPTQPQQPAAPSHPAQPAAIPAEPAQPQSAPATATTDTPALDTVEALKTACMELAMDLVNSDQFEATWGKVNINYPIAHPRHSTHQKAREAVYAAFRDNRMEWETGRIIDAK